MFCLPDSPKRQELKKRELRHFLVCPRSLLLLCVLARLGTGVLLHGPSVFSVSLSDRVERGKSVF